MFNGNITQIIETTSATTSTNNRLKPLLTAMNYIANELTRQSTTATDCNLIVHAYSMWPCVVRLLAINSIFVAMGA